MGINALLVKWNKETKNSGRKQNVKTEVQTKLA